MVSNTSSVGVANLGRKRRRFRLFGSRKRNSILLSVVVSTTIIGSALGWLALNSRGKFSAGQVVVSAAKSAVGADATIQGKDTGRTNILVYGMTLDGARTDSIVLVSYYWQEKKVVTLNIPRDMYVYDGYENAKMGEVYAYAQQRNSKDTTYASSYVAMVIAKEYGISIDYWYKLNMQGEVDLINAIGGVDVTVPNAFTDYEYPTWNYSGYIRPAPTFAAGLQHMNGSTALIYSRSRHSLDNSEGSDFARSNRQALVIQAVMTKLKSMGVVGNLPEISKYSSILGQNVDTSMSTDEMVSFAKTLKTLNPATDFVHGNWATGNGFLCDTTSSYGAYIILYGNAGTCGVQAGVSETSTAKDLAVYYVKNLLTSAVMTPEQFVTAASAALHPATTTTVSP